MDDNSTATTKLICDIVSNIKPFDDIEKHHKEDILAWIISGVPLFRSGAADLPDKHLVSYCILFDEDKAKILLTDHKKAGLWLPTGGHVDPDENPADAAKRECFEEVHINADFWHDEPVFLSVSPIVGNVAKHIDVALWYVLKGHSQKECIFNEREFYSICWFGFDDILYEKSDPHMQRFISKLKTML